MPRDPNFNDDHRPLACGVCGFVAGAGIVVLVWLIAS
jgi:hypothetical protein